MISQYDKAFAALIVSGLATIITRKTGLPVPPEWQVYIAAFLVAAPSGFFVWLFPNRKGTTS